MTSPSPIALAGRIPPAPVLAILSRYKREDIEAFIAVAIDLLDLSDGDPDCEDATDLEDDHSLSPDASAFGDGPGDALTDPGGQCDEDGINTSLVRARHGGPGCQISDGDSGVEDWPHDAEEDVDVNPERR
jgi:hypothetical protein